MRAHQVEVVDVVPVTVAILARLDSGADVQLELETSLPVAVDRPQPHLHDRLRYRSDIPVAGLVHDPQLHCCCCWGIALPSSPTTLAGTLLGWEYVSRIAISSWRSSARHSASKSRGCSAIDSVSLFSKRARRRLSSLRGR